MWSRLRTKIAVSVVVTSVSATANIAYVHNSPSQYEVACHKLGLNQPMQPEALLRIFQMSGYLKQNNLWSALYRSQSLAQPADVFIQSMNLLNKYSADKEPQDFDAGMVTKNLFGKSQKYFWQYLWPSKAEVTDTEAAEIILYLGQTAFDRKTNQERSELNNYNWMTEYSSQYFQEARKLDLIDSIEPNYEIDYNLALVLGASRAGLYARLVELNYYIANDLKADAISVLAGQRELWAQIDGISPKVLDILISAKNDKLSMKDVNIKVLANPPQERTDEGKKYLVELAQKSAISFNLDNPIVDRDGRSYLNYAPDETSKLTETLMSLDLLEEFGLNYHIVDTIHHESAMRPNTQSTAKDTAERFIKEVIDGKYGGTTEFNLLAVSNNPYINRQAIAVQREFNKIIEAHGLADKIIVKIHGVGFQCLQGVTTIHSELGALISELFVDAYSADNIDTLMFRTRDNDMDIPEMPTLGDNIE